MKNKKVVSLYFRVILVLVYSFLLSIVTSGVILGILYAIYKQSTNPGFIINYMKYYYYSYGLVLPTSVLLIVLLFVYFSILIRKPVNYMNQVEHITNELAEGHFEIEIPKDSMQLPLHIFDNLESMKVQLDYLIKEEKRNNNLKNDLITNVSHDLRTPLTSMIGYLQLIEQNKYKDEVELMYYVDIAYEKSIRLNRMVNDLFEYTKLQNEEVILYSTTLHLNELMKQLIAQFLPETSKKSISIDLDERDLNVKINADPDKIVRVFENIISNALKYGSEGKDIRIVLSKNNSNAMVEIINFGEPIPRAAIPLLFDRLYRVETSRSIETGGTGLGLAIAKGIVDSHHGDIKVTSNHQRTSFKVILPLCNTVKELE